MTSLLRFSGFTAMTLAAVLSITAGLAIAGDDVSSDQIVNALQPKPLTRGLSVSTPADPAARARELGFINSLRNRTSRSLSLGERAEIADLTPTKPRIDLEIQFDYNSARIARSSSQAVQELGKALSNPALRGSTFVVAGHTDGIGGYAFNQDLSERRADTIKHYLMENYGIPGSDLVTVGYGKTRLKDAQHPTDPINRRVEIVNLQTQSASNKVAPCCASQ